MFKTFTGSTLLLSLVLLAACDKSASEKSTEANQALASVSNKMNEATAKARLEIAKSNMSLGTLNGKAKAEITPMGDLLIDSKPVTITPAQRQLLMTHRQILTKVAVSGMEIGTQGVDFAGKAVGDAINSIFNGDTRQLEQKVEAGTKKIEASINTLCTQMPLLFASQERLAIAIPAFKPYAKMKVDDFDECKQEIVVRNN
ncbi:MAG: hypothetical protein ABIP02_09425 [Arenimonas sp.]